MDLKKYREALNQLPEGVKAAEVYAAEGESFSVRIREGEIETYSVANAFGLSLRADCGKMGYAYTETEDDPDRLMKLAMENAACVESKDDQELYPGAEQYPDAPAVDERLKRASAAQKIALAKELERRMLAHDSRIRKLQTCALSTGTNRSAILNSLGLDLSQTSGMAMAYCMPIAEVDGTVKNGQGWRAASCLEELDLDGIVKDAAEDLFSQFGAQPVETGEYKILLKNSAMCDLLDSFESMFSADAAQKGLSLLAGREGETVASPLVTIVDDPMAKNALCRSAFDDEGVPGEATTVVEKGVLKSLLHNLKTARKAGCRTTGNASKAGAASPVGVAASNFFICPGEGTRDELLEQMGEGLYITGVSGLHAGCNPVSGSFSLLARGFLVEGGRMIRPVEQITLSGLFLDLLQKVERVGGDFAFDMPGGSTFGSPSLLIGKLPVAGK